MLYSSATRKRTDSQKREQVPRLTSVLEQGRTAQVTLGVILHLRCHLGCIVPPLSAYAEDDAESSVA